MSAPSFPSFAPSFSSFPDLGRSPSARTKSPEQSDAVSTPRDRSEEPRRKRKDKSERRVHRREKHIPHLEEATPDSNTWVCNRVLDDERRKQVEDRRLSTQEYQGNRHRESCLTFLSDRKGDPLNITYGSIHAGDIPKYRIAHRGKYVLGLVGDWSVFRKAGKGVEIVLGSSRKCPGLTDFHTKAILNAPPRRLNATRKSYKYEEVNGFLRLPSGGGQKSDLDYRTIVKSEVHSDSGSSETGEEGSDEDEDDGPPVLPSEQLAIKELEQKVAQTPDSVETWLYLVTRSLSAVPPTSKNASKVRSDITLSILTRALDAHPSNSTSHHLRLKYLRAGEEIWNESKLKFEWEGALRLGDIEIWMEWLQWRIRKAPEGINFIMVDAMRALQTLGQSEDKEVDKLRVVWCVAVAFQEAGFYERATALFQAQAELTFEVPQSLYGLPVETQLEALEEFWESEVPRVGESNAKGWSSWVSSGRPKAVPTGEETARMDVDSMSSMDSFSSWYEDEIRADRLSRTPARSTDEKAASDPYSTVLFSDIRPLLLSLTTQRAKCVFRLMWLTLLGLHIPGFSRSFGDETWDDRWSYAHLTSVARLSSIFPGRGFSGKLLADSCAGALVGKEREYSSAFGPVKDWGLNVIGPLEWIKKEHWRMWTSEDIQAIDLGFVRAVFSQLRCGTEDHEWDTYALAFEAAVNMKQALKLSRSFLSTARDSLPHWAAHARLEHLRGRLADARKVYQTVLIATRRPPIHAFVGQLWWDWAEMEWLSGDKDVALRVVMRAGNVDGTGGTMILRAKRNLEDIMHASHERWKDRESWVKLRAVMELLTTPSPASCLGVFDAQPVGGTGKPDRQRESKTVASFLMLYNHSMMLRAPSPPAFLRDRLQAAMESYPSNTIILGMFIEAEKGYGVWGRIRSQMGHGIGGGETKHKDVARRVAEVWMAGLEEGRWEREIERTRSGLSAAAEDERTKNSPIIWRVVIEFETRAGQMQRAKDLLYRAVSECPLAKELYLLAFGPLREAFKPRELEAFVDVMADRGIRMRRDLDEYGNHRRESKDVEDGGSSGESEDEIELEAKERRRLMPY